MAQTQENSQRR